MRHNRYLARPLCDVI